MTKHCTVELDGENGRMQAAMHASSDAVLSGGPATKVRGAVTLQRRVDEPFDPMLDVWSIYLTHQ